MSGRMAQACSSAPFSNGTEGEAWMDKWCSYCVHDHGAHDDTYENPCMVIGMAMLGMPSDEIPWPEVWLPEPDDGPGSLPSRLVCLQFEACTKGDCTGDPGAEARSERVTEVQVYWRGVS